jgi:hypothetical protein
MKLHSNFNSFLTNITHPVMALEKGFKSSIRNITKYQYAIRNSVRHMLLAVYLLPVGCGSQKKIFEFQFLLEASGSRGEKK